MAHFSKRDAFVGDALVFSLFSLQIDPRSVDVNVHPTKREVHFLNEEAIIEQISDALQEALVVRSHSRVFEYQVCNLFQRPCL